MSTLANTFSILFHLRNKKLDDKKVAIYARITINKKRLELSVKQMMNPSDWNENEGLAKPITEEYLQLNMYLEQLRNAYYNAYRDMVLQKREISTDSFRKVYFGIEEDEYTLKKLMNYHNIDMKESISWGTMKNYFTTQKYLEKFLVERRKVKDINLKNINYKFVTDFEYYLKTYQPLDHQKSLHNNGVMKHMERFRKMINVALKNEWMEKDPFKAYKLKFNRFERGYLTEDELSVLEEKNFSIERLQAVKDLFIFSCYTGLSYIDTVNLTPANVMKGIDSSAWLITKRTKTSVPVKVPLLQQALDIIEKYQNNPKCLAEQSLLPKMSNQKLNGYLKEIADLCDIEKNLTFHLARHTFATTVTLSNGVPIESVSKMLGHSKITTTQVMQRLWKGS